MITFVPHHCSYPKEAVQRSLFGQYHKERITGYLWNGSRVSDGCHDFTDEVHGDVTHHPGSLVFLMGERLRGFALFSNYDARTQRKALILITCLFYTFSPVEQCI